MPVEVVAAVLLAALVHAGWNAVAKSAGARDPLLSTCAIALGGAVVSLPLLLLTGLPAPASHPHVLASGVVHVAYFILVGLAYRTADYSAIYPLTRGSAPLMTALLAATLLGETLPPLGWLGIALLSAGILGLGANAMLKGSIDARALIIAALNIGVIVAYTLLDGAGTRLSGNPAAYVLTMMALTGLFLLPIMLAWLGRDAIRSMLPHWCIALIGGAMVSLSYGIALWAMTKAPIGLVAALRETSVLFACVIATVVLGERFGLVRWLSAGLIVAGMVAMRIG
jgi:drug/metabolite transporter (DMT)-like permease